MPTEPKLEHYLNALDKALGKLSVSDRAEIITEIKSHILEAKEKNPDQELSQILASLGEPENVANRYLIERGLSPGKPSRSPIIKWLVVGFLGTFGILTAGTILLVWTFTPLLKVDEENGRITLLGGMIDINESLSAVQIGGSTITMHEEHRSLGGSIPVDPKKIEKLSMNFSNGKVEVKPSQDKQLHWSCKVVERTNKENSTTQKLPKKYDQTDEHKKQIELDFAGTKGVKCELEVPEKLAVHMNGSNGNIEVEKAPSPVDITLSNGKVEINPDLNRHYQYETKVTNGKMDAFTSSKEKDALLIKVTLANGVISNESESN